MTKKATPHNSFQDKMTEVVLEKTLRLVVDLPKRAFSTFGNFVLQKIGANSPEEKAKQLEEVLQILEDNPTILKSKIDNGNFTPEILAYPCIQKKGNEIITELLLRKIHNTQGKFNQMLFNTNIRHCEIIKQVLNISDADFQIIITEVIANLIPQGQKEQIGKLKKVRDKYNTIKAISDN